MADDEKVGNPVLPTPTEMIETLDSITSEAQTLRKKITDALVSSAREARPAATNDPSMKRKKTAAKRKKTR